jgi:hypothetical protein
MASGLSGLVAEASTEFLASGRDRRYGAANPFYVPTTAVVVHRSTRAPDDVGRIDLSRVEPISFITQDGWASDQRAEVPSLTLIVGQYGVGKTEVVHQLCSSVSSRPGVDAETAVLPISLARCPEFKNFSELAKQHKSDEQRAAALAHALFARIAEPPWTPDKIETQLLSAIRRGEVVLVLDGLDEVVSNRPELGMFFRALGRLLRGDDAVIRSRAVVTLRAEMLRTLVGADEAIDRSVNPKGVDQEIALHVLWIDFFGDSDIAAYLTARLEEGKAVYNQLSRQGELLTLLSRPLLLRIFCDLLYTPSGHALDEASRAVVITELAETPHVTKLLERFVALAADDLALIDSQQAISNFRWSREQLAVCALRLYRDRRSSLEPEDVRSILMPIRPDISSGNAAALSDELALQGIHKCPFLHRREGANQVHFSHRIFLEYFTALGMSMTVQRDAQASEFNEFDELVLNVDMRKFLKEILAGEWYRRTRLSYGFDRRDEWKARPTEVEFAELESLRRDLLDIMTNVPSTVDELEKAERRISTFLEYPSLVELHPRYLMYNFEAVAVYLSYFRLRQTGQEVDRRLKNVLQNLSNRASERLRSSETRSIRQSWELLIERCLDIALRLHYPWLRAMGPKLQSLIEKDDVRQRVEAILRETRA